MMGWVLYLSLATNPGHFVDSGKRFKSPSECQHAFEVMKSFKGMGWELGGAKPDYLCIPIRTKPTT